MKYRSIISTLLIQAILCTAPRLTVAATVVGVPCFNTYPTCATEILDLELPSGRFDVTFKSAAFNEVFPDPLTYMFWGDIEGASQAAAQIAKVLAAERIPQLGEVSQDPSVILFTNGFAIPYAPYNDYVSYAIGGATWGMQPETWVTYKTTTNLQSSVFPVFSPSLVPEPNVNALVIFGLLSAAAVSRKIRRRNR